MIKEREEKKGNSNLHEREIKLSKQTVYLTGFIRHVDPFHDHGFFSEQNEHSCIDMNGLTLLEFR